MSKTVKALNAGTGLVAAIPPGYLTHPKFSKIYVAVDDEQKSYVAELYKSKTVDEYLDIRKQADPVVDEADDTTDEEND